MPVPPVIFMCSIGLRRSRCCSRSPAPEWRRKIFQPPKQLLSTAALAPTAAASWPYSVLLLRWDSPPSSSPWPCPVCFSVLVIDHEVLATYPDTVHRFASRRSYHR